MQLRRGAESMNRSLTSLGARPLVDEVYVGQSEMLPCQDYQKRRRGSQFISELSSANNESRTEWQRYQRRGFVCAARSLHRSSPDTRNCKRKWSAFPLTTITPRLYSC